MKNRRIVLASRPQGWVTPENFRLEEVELPALQEGEALVRNHFLSLDPYRRGWMNEGPSYRATAQIGDVIIGEDIGEVIESRDPSLKPGDMVSGYFGWQEYGIAPASQLRKVDGKRAPVSLYLGTLGMPGITAWIGLKRIGEARPGETVVVSAAAGAVGSVVGQLAKSMGCRAVGIAGGPAKCEYVVNHLGFDACIDYKAGNLWEDLKAVTPAGVDVYFENVGGEIMDTVFRRMNTFGRVPVCGLISQYNSEPYPSRSMGLVLINRLRVQGFIVSDHMELWPEAQEELLGLFEQGRLKYHETIAEGLENAPQAFIGMLKGENLGKQLVRL